jgi:methionyl-tRNA formyltransferase
MWLQNLQNHPDVSVEAAFIPKSYRNDCAASLQFLNKHDIPYRVPDEFGEKTREWLNQFSLDLGFSVGYDRKLPPWAYEFPDRGTVNLHPSLLPRYRGANPYFWVIRNREDETGVTLHRMDEDYDTGPIIQQKSVALTEDVTVGELFNRLNTLGVDMIMDLVDELSSAESALQAEEQPPSDGAPEAPKLRDRDLRLDWKQSFADIDALIRAGNPHFGAFTTFKGTKVRIYQVTHERNEGADSEPPPGTVQTTQNGPRVRCGNGWARLELVQVGERYYATGTEFQRREKKAFRVLDKMI